MRCADITNTITDILKYYYYNYSYTPNLIFNKM